MKRNVAREVLARLAASLAALFILMIAPAMAADRADINILGYSQEGPYFAFEEFGIHDGSGGAFSNIYILDMSTDSWVGGGPITVDMDDSGGDPEAKPLTEVRDEARAKAAAKLKELTITAPYEILALNGDGEHGDTKNVNFWTPNCCGPATTEDTKFTLKLTNVPVKNVSDDCKAAYGGEDPIVGFKLEFTDPTGQTGKPVLHEDGDSLPKSRGCTLDYGIYAVVGPSDSFIGRVAIIETWPFGFEGADRRFIAVPIDG